MACGWAASGGLFKLLSSRIAAAARRATLNVNLENRVNDPEQINTPEQDAEAQASVASTTDATEEASAARGRKRRRKRDRRRRIDGKKALVAVISAFAIGCFVFTLIVQWRLSLASESLVEIGEPTPIEAVGGASKATGAITADVTYSSIVTDDGEDATETIEWNDDWFFADSSEYNHKIARAGIVLSAMANSESVYYQTYSDSQDYMKHTLAKLGFDNVSTASYKYRSKVIDQLSEVFSKQGTDVTAYTIASKNITNSQTGENKLLVMVAIRGSYGTEWFSNLTMGLRIDKGDYGLNKDDHTGFSEAATELQSQIYEYLKNLGELDELGNVSLFLCGHSRGAAIANLTANVLDKIDSAAVEASPDSGLDMDAWDQAHINKKSIYAYCFATPELTADTECRDDTYNNIFNILNPADIVPRMPLSAWGYDRYGIDLWLPEYGSNGFDQQFNAVKAKFREHIRCDTKSSPTDVGDVDKIVSDIAQIAPTLSDFQTPLGVVKSLGAILDGHDIVRIIHSHAPDLYSAWMETIEPSDLRTSR